MPRKVSRGIMLPLSHPPREHVWHGKDHGLGQSPAILDKGGDIALVLQDSPMSEQVEMS